MGYNDEEIRKAERSLLFWSWAGIFTSFALVAWLIMGSIE